MLGLGCQEDEIILSFLLWGFGIYFSGGIDDELHLFVVDYAHTHLAFNDSLAW